MFGLSLGKILAIAALILALWYGYAWLKRVKAKRDVAAALRAATQKEGGSAAARAAGDAARGPADLAACPACGTYVAPGLVRCPSGRADCPMPAA